MENIRHQPGLKKNTSWRDDRLQADCPNITCDKDHGADNVTVHHDPLQFAYREKVGVEDAITYMVYRSLSHLEKGIGCKDYIF